MIQLRTPLSESQVRKLSLGERVSLSGRIFTARDRAHPKLIQDLPSFLKEGIIYHCGPIARPKDSGWEIISAGPTTSSRMNAYTPELIQKLKIRAIIGKGGMDSNVVQAMSKYGCVYLAFPGGAGVLAARSILKVIKLHYPELGMAEGVWELEVENLEPLIVAIDSHGNSIYQQLEIQIQNKLQRLLSSIQD